MKSVLKAGLKEDVDVMVPTSELTIKQIQDRIPAKFFERSTMHSVLYLARDTCQLLAAYFIMYRWGVPALAGLEGSVYGANGSNVGSWLLVGAVKLLAWNAFWFVQGLNGTAFWVLAHECGHQAFSPYRAVNNSVGLVLHSALLVPYHSWRISHGIHHKHTNHLTKDTVFIPRKENKVIELVEETPLAMLWGMLVLFLFGWPMYLLTNVAGQDYGRRTNHFEPSSPLFRKEDAADIVLSDVGVLATLSVLGLCTYQFGFSSVYCWYLVPYLWVNFWLLYITYLQHTDIRIPHYTQEHWTFVRGAIAAVDRDYGFLLNDWLHHINDSHVVHHLFSQMPFYNAIVVTREYIRGILGDTYVEDHRPLVVALCDSWRHCRYVIPSEGVSVFYGCNRKRA
ncbi:putative mitochondrial Fatty acid desaturase [Leptomonas pyrrhocoris]|uniref:Putative mitochondrial Fatty acid desaturase n=1 Tax=Leptomonas pyrrhocoris TaxID=157538 RepID=A0A0M9G881_LEPPY|nr:putative mitochondrial Fatty acid desaturase [Leptomonas pyrrhocoris]XP_015662905.1 putative mitochondrial Fatty acid desaturase [Leptomonas pyrrhocoris]KPA84465.1 putative mitochondrial Fatty acid desaturase [Leptomonas pyrrhocoris]KPA84466.1 putative mitochondrial Fatty acid desaturase [Leptomonas pyrrhocoris]|eukprot:XP_015662904.1 putative mitochondrial Fatty acid desaturase [Leptomonas pyrrhocoris]